MIFIVILIAFVMERFFYWHHLRHWDWFINYERKLGNYMGQFSPGLRLLVSVLLPTVLVGLISYILSGLLFGLLWLIFATLILLYCLGPDNLWVQVYKSVRAIKEDPQVGVPQAEAVFNIENAENSQMFHRHFVKAIIIAAHQRVFSVIFWFAILGPLGAVLYRLIELFSLRTDLGMEAHALKIKNLMDWLPVRLFSFLFALAGHFTGVFNCLKQGFLKKPEDNEQLLTDCGLAALDIREEEVIPENGDAEEAALALLDRTFVIGLVLLAIVVLVI